MTIAMWEIALRLLLAVILGGAIGFERESHNRPAGFRTHILVCAGSTLLMLVSAYGFTGQLGEGFISDPGRIAAGVVTGIGFLGAGTIIQQRGSVRGLTTAATIWVVSGVGLAVGVGFYLGAILTTFFVMLSLLFLRRFERSYFKKRRLKRLLVRAVDQPGLLGRIGSALGDLKVNIRKSELGEPENVGKGDGEEINIELLVEAPLDINLQELFQRLYELDGISEIYWQHEKIHKNKTSNS
ncbi:MAG TPA: MgtC/SapB family protein [Firmicutes bacterium]|nr:MgtC/SapB family protein [Bacillota bacterium]